MIACNILCSTNNNPLPETQVCKIIDQFGESYSNAAQEIIDKSIFLDSEGVTFIKCSKRILSNFGMTRKGIFHTHLDETLESCWNQIGSSIIEMKKRINESGLSRSRFIVDINDQDREIIINKIWRMTKQILPFTMSSSSYGLVGASKILFSVLPEIVLPIDNAQWKQLFKTVDLGDILRFMVKDTQRWEETTKVKLDTVDKLRRLTTIPSIYNAIAMEMRPKNL